MTKAYSKSLRSISLQGVLLLMISITQIVWGQPVENTGVAPKDVVIAAETGLHSFLDRIALNKRGEYGFDDDEDVDQSSLGIPFKLYTITPSSIFSYHPGDPVASTISETSLWYFPIVLDDKTRSILVVDWIDNHWEAVSLGYAQLAVELVYVRRTWPTSEGYHPQLVVVYQAKEYLFTVPERDLYNLTPLVTEDDNQILDTLYEPELKYATLDYLENVVRMIRPIIKDNISERN